jgi:F-type H+-transporting ATPase subunit delta
MADHIKTRPDHVLEDPGALAIASLYARSYLDAARRNGIPDTDAEEELATFVDEVVQKFPELSTILASESIGRDDKLALIDRSIAPRCTEFFCNFLKVLVRHGRGDLIRSIRQVMVRIREELAGQRRVELRLARPLSDYSRTKLYDHLKSTLGFDPLLRETVDPALIGGLVIQIGDTVYDSSLRTRLKQLSGRLVERAFNEIQSGRDRFSHPEGD